MHNRGMIYGYARVSTAAQDETGQVRQLKAAGCEKVFREKITGTTADRPQLGKLMKQLAPGDVVITPALTGYRATRPTYLLSPARCSAPGPVSAQNEITTGSPAGNERHPGPVGSEPCKEVRCAGRSKRPLSTC